MKNISKLLIILVVGIVTLQADLKSDLTSINTSVVDLNSAVNDTNITAKSLCAPLIALNQQARAIVETITSSSASMSAPLVVDNETMVLVETLFTNVATLSGSSLGLSSNVATLAPMASPLTLSEGITAMLQLSSDIGEMADRIGEMADNILVMADNIGLMADRILLTQEIQSTNLATTQTSVLQTQTNMLSLVSVAETASYDLTIDSLVVEGNLLVARMMAIAFSPWTIASQLQDVKADVNAYLLSIQTLNSTIKDNAANSRTYINSTSLLALSNISVVMTSLGSVLDAYVIGIESIKNITNTSSILDAMDSMLAMSADIGKMSNLILEMSDNILLMADNIGMTADQILLTQTTQSVNITTTQAAILGAQQMAIAIIVARD